RHGGRPARRDGGRAPRRSEAPRPERDRGPRRRLDPTSAERPGEVSRRVHPKVSADRPRERRGPVEDHAWPARLSARVATARPVPRIHGYAIADDLARYYSLAEQTLLALTGAIPDEATGRAFEWAMQMLG